MSTAATLIQRTRRRLSQQPRPIYLTLSADIAAGARSIPFTDLTVNSVNSRSLLTGITVAIDLELYSILATPSGGAFAVQPGVLGSTTTAHAQDALITVNPQFSDFDILEAINTDLDDLSTAGNGLFNIASTDIVYNPVYEAYDLDVPGFRQLIAVRFKTPLPDHRSRLIPRAKWEVVPVTDGDSNFPSSWALNIYEGGWPGQPLVAIYKQAFSHLVNLTDDVQAVAGLPAEWEDLPPLGAMIQLVAPGEIQRNQINAQGDSRIAPEVPPGGIMNSVAGELRERTSRIAAAALDMHRQIGQMRRRY